MDINKEYTYQFDMPKSVPLYSLVNLKHLVFEVTTNCNLNCTYCGYGPLYNTRTHHERIQMPFVMAKRLIDYLYELWSTHKNDYDVRETCIGFYGGEPLLNFDFISSVVSYIEELPLKNRHFFYTMTTNAVLLDRYMDFIAEKEFLLLISLDGDKTAHSYRVDHNDRNSFDKVFENVKKLQAKYPEYFDKYVSFNSVLTNRADLFGVKDFIMKEFNKNPMVTEVNDFGIQESQKDKFKEIHYSITKELSQKPYEEILKRVDFNKNPVNKIAYQIIKNISGNSFRSYNALLTSKQGSIFPTGTCFPFDKKMFVNVKGDILPCERINQQYCLGKITEEGVELDFEAIAKKYSDYYKRVHKKCIGCYAKPICEQCMFYINDLDNNPSCPNYLTKQKYEELVNSNLAYLAENPQIYQRMMKEMF